MSVLDLSNHDEPTFDAGCLAASGVTRVIMGCQLGAGPARRMVPALRGAGIEVRDLYAFLGFRDWWTQPAEQAVAAARALGGITRIWLDAEADNANDGTSGDDVTPPMRLTRLGQAVSIVEAAGFAAGVYTARWWWVPRMADSRAFSQYPLWLGGPYQAEPIREVAFGGWRDVAIHQYTSTFVVCGRGRDANHVFEEEDEMADPRVDELVAALGGIERIRAWNANGNDLLLGYEMEQRKLAEHLAQPAAEVGDHEHYSGKVIR